MRTGRLAQRTRQLRQAAHVLEGVPSDYDPLLQFIGDARYVLIGEATRGTHEFYKERAAITRRLIGELGFGAVAVEADWPDAYRVNAYARGASTAASSEEALRGFRRFPAWIWRNRDVLDFVDWLRTYNDGLTPEERVGFYGLDLYNMYRSMETVVDYLEISDPEAAERAKFRYSRFEDFREDSQAYGHAATFGLSKGCEEGAVARLVELQRRAIDDVRADGLIEEDHHFDAEQNERIGRNAARYYRSMLGGRVSSWNLRDHHMMDTLTHLAAHLDRRGGHTRMVVWEHNSHLGDARATDMGRAGEINLGQLVRERWGRNAVSVGLTTYEGTVTAAAYWGGPARRWQMTPAIEESYEALFHATDLPALMLLTPEAESVLPPRGLQRAIGAIYRPESERLSHYFGAALSRQFDALLHFDKTTAVEPLDIAGEWTAEPETYLLGQ